jgi:hypothetical protein
MSRRLRILTWHVHGNYLWYLTQTGHDLYLPVREGVVGYGGRGHTFPFGENVHDVPAGEICRLEFDCILYQGRNHYMHDRHELLAPEQLTLPQVYLEHDPPKMHPTDESHWFDEPGGLLIHVTPFNALMWDSHRVAVRVIEHGVPEHLDVAYTGRIARGLAVVNNMAARDLW